MGPTGPVGAVGDSAAAGTPPVETCGFVQGSSSGPRLAGLRAPRRRVSAADGTSAAVGGGPCGDGQDLLRPADCGRSGCRPGRSGRAFRRLTTPVTRGATISPVSGRLRQFGVTTRWGRADALTSRYPRRADLVAHAGMPVDEAEPVI